MDFLCRRHEPKNFGHHLLSAMHISRKLAGKQKSLISGTLIWNMGVPSSGFNLLCHSGSMPALIFHPSARKDVMTSYNLGSRESALPDALVL